MTSIRTCESTCVGHPDKLCDLIADTILDDLLFEDPSARCAVEVMATKGWIIVAGEITSSVKVSIRAAVRRALTRTGGEGRSCSPARVIRARCTGMRPTRHPSICRCRW